MNRYETQKGKPLGSEVGNYPLSSPVRIKSEREKELIRGNRRTGNFPTSDPSSADLEDFEAHIASLLSGRHNPDRAELEGFLRAHPGSTVRDWKGKGPSVPLDAEHGDKSWHRLRTADVRRIATSAFARELPRNVRQAAARDPGLIWNQLARKYRQRLASDPGGASKVSGLPGQGPASVTNALSMTKFCEEKGHG